MTRRFVVTGSCAAAASSSLSSSASRFRLCGRETYGGWDRSSSSSGRSNCKKVGEWYGSGFGASSGALHTTCTQWVFRDGFGAASKDMADMVGTAGSGNR